MRQSLLPSRGNVVSVMGNSVASICSLAIFRLQKMVSEDLVDQVLSCITSTSCLVLHPKDP